jgi:hypothetical protein
MKLLATQSANVSVTFLTAEGHHAKVQGDVSWVSSNAAATVMADEADSHKATITAGPSAGTATITATADADLGEGVTNVSAMIPVEIIARGAAVGGEITVDHVDHGLPGQPAHSDNTLPGQPEHPSNALPGKPGHVDNDLPDHAKPKR